MVGTVEEFRKAIIRELRYVQVARMCWPITAVWSNNHIEAQQHGCFRVAETIAEDLKAAERDLEDLRNLR